MRVYANCLGCGQRLVVPADDLQQTLTCPRCGKSQRVVDILDKSIALPPVLDGDVSKAQPALPGGFETGKLHADADTEPDAPAFDLPVEPVPHAESPCAHLVTPDDSAGSLQPITSAGGQSPDLLAVGSAPEGEPSPTKVGIFAQLVLVLVETVGNFDRKASRKAAARSWGRRGNRLWDQMVDPRLRVAASIICVRPVSAVDRMAVVTSG